MNAAVRPRFPPFASIKPLRALSLLALFTGLWLAARTSLLIDEFGAALAAFESRAGAAFHRTIPSLPKRTSLTAIAPRETPLHDILATLPVMPRAATPPMPVATVAAAVQNTAFADVTQIVSMVVGVGETRFRLAAQRPPPVSRSPPVAGAVAQEAYDSLAIGDRRAAVTGFATAAALDPDDARADAWLRQAERLGRRWSGSAYIFARGAGPPGFASAALLGGGQSGATLAFTPEPLATRPVSVTLRGAVAHDGLGLDTASAQAAFGVRWQVFRGISLSAEGLVANGDAAPSGWTARVAGGAVGHSGFFEWNGYAETGVVNANPYGAGQGFFGWRLPARRVHLALGGGVWGAAQHDGATVDRLDLGPSLRVHWGDFPVDLLVDYRVRVAGNAAPGTGVAVTLAGYF